MEHRSSYYMVSGINYNYIVMSFYYIVKEDSSCYIVNDVYYIVMAFNPFIPELLKLTLPSLNQVRTIVLNRDLGQKSK